MTRALRTAWPVQVAVLSAVVALHIALRDTTWRYDWATAVFQFGFVTVMTAPIALGFSAFASQRLRPLAEQADVAGSWLRHNVSGLASATLPTLATHLGGLAAVAAITAATTRIGPTWWQVLPAVVPALTLVAASAIGWAAGSYRGGWWVAPAAAVAWFALTITGYRTGPEVMVRVGGAGSPFVDGGIPLSWTLHQLLWFAALAICGLAFVAAPSRTGASRTVAVRGGAVVATAAAVAYAVTAGSLQIEHRPTPMVCEGSQPEICVARGWQSLLDPIRTGTETLLAAWAETGRPTPARLTQLPGDGDPAVTWRIDPLSVDPDEPLTTANLVLNSHLGMDCPWNLPYDTSPGSPRAARDDVFRWLVNRSRGGGGFTDPWLQGPPADQLTRVKADLDRLEAACGTAARPG